MDVLQKLELSECTAKILFYLMQTSRASYTVLKLTIARLVVFHNLKIATFFSCVYEPSDKQAKSHPHRGTRRRGAG